MKIISNNQPRPLLRWWDLTEKEQQEFDWLETVEEQSCADFFRYKGQVYCLDEFTNLKDGPFSGWDGVYAGSFFSGVLVKFINVFDDEIIVGRYYS